jgi:uncharacterized membrane protein
VGGAVAGSAFAPNPFEWPFATESRVLALECGGRRVVLEASPDKAWLFLPYQTLQLHRVYSEPLHYGHGDWLPMNPSDSQVSGEPGRFVYDTQVFVQYDRANSRESVVLQEGEARMECVVDRRETPFEAAKLGGAEFRGLGNEPGWELVIWQDRMRLVHDYGTSELEVPLAGEPEVLVDGTGSRFRGELNGRVLEAMLRLGPCQDSMSGWEYETRVTVSFDGRTLEGCGKALH